MKNSNKKVDAIVIGAGLGGLSCALHLAKRGMNVQVLEKQPKIGGYAQNFVREGFDFDVSLHVLPAMGQGESVRKILEYLQVIDKLHVVEHDPMFCSTYEDTAYHLPGKEHIKEYLKEKFPSEAKGLDGFFDTTRTLVNANSTLFWDGQIDVNNFPPGEYFKKTYQQLLDQFFTDRRLMGILDQLWQSTGLPASMCAANWTTEVMGSHLLTGNFYIKGGGGQLSIAMGQTLAEAGGAIETCALVDKIIVEDRKVKGVQLENGDRIFADIVVANTNPQQVYLELIGKEFLAKPFVYKLGTYTHSLSLITLYLGLSCPAKQAGITNHTTFVNADYDTTRAYNSAMAGDFTITDYVISDYTDDDSLTHPAGKGMAQILEATDGKQWTGISQEAYREKKDEVTETILNKVSRRYPQLRSNIEVCTMGTPRTMALQTRNPNGSVYGFAQTPNQADNYRFPVAGLFEGLYFTGAWSRGGGGGYTGALINGRVASNEIMARHNWPKAQVTFDIPGNPKLIMEKKSKDSRLKIDKAAYYAEVEPNDISTEGELLPEACVKTLSGTARRYINERKAELVTRWNGFADKSEWSVRYFQMRFVFVPFSSVKTGDRIRIETRFIPGEPGKGEFTQDIFLDKTDTKLANAGGRVIIRQS